jgi:hypothetical protein
MTRAPRRCDLETPRFKARRGMLAGTRAALPHLQLPRPLQRRPVAAVLSCKALRWKRLLRRRQQQNRLLRVQAQHHHLLQDVMYHSRRSSWLSISMSPSMAHPLLTVPHAPQLTAQCKESSQRL